VNLFCIKVKPETSPHFTVSAEVEMLSIWTIPLMMLLIGQSRSFLFGGGGGLFANLTVLISQFRRRRLLLLQCWT
jgi:hypothetical protein